MVTAIVTGAGGGIGLATARLLLERGVAVTGVDRDSASLEPLRDAGGTPLVADLATERGCSLVADAHRGPDHLVNAAGLQHLGSIFEVTRADWAQLFAVNAEATFFLCQAIGPQMPAGGSIVNLSSSAAKDGTTTEIAPYAATKAGVLAITRSFAHALAPRRVRVNAVCPGIIDTVMQEHVLDGLAALRGTTAEAISQARLAKVPLGRAGTAEECARVIAFLLSGESSYITGEAINVTGGWVTW